MRGPALSDRLFHSYVPRDGHGLAHDPLTAIVAPRPIGWISTVNTAGVANLAPYSFFNLFSYRPPIIGFSSGGEKDSLVNARAMGEFVWNLAGRAQAEAMNMTSATVPPGSDEFGLAGLEKLPSQDVRAPRVAGSPVQFECRVTQIVRLDDANGAQTTNWMVFGEAIRIHIDPAYVVDGVYQTTLARPVTRGGGTADYFETTQDSWFRMKRPG
jgi:flavin reductase (DIM6/NTAB) family NADH-FMN oxidoreductase RutF